MSAFLLVSLAAIPVRTGGLPVPPEVISTSPASGEANVSLLANISIVFNKPMNMSSERWNITPFIPLTSSWWNSTTLNLTHSVPLAPSAHTWIWLTANDSVGTPVRRGYHNWMFTTSCGGTCIVETSPNDGEKNVGLDEDIIIIFSDPPSPTAISVSIVPGLTFTTTWTTSTMLTLTHASPFSLCSLYSVTVGGVVPGPVPNPWSFMTMCPGATFVEVAAIKGLAGVDGSFYAWGDYNRDGYEDLLIDGKRLFRNNGPQSNFTFIEATAEAGIGSTTVNNGVWGDYDNDGWLDFYAPGGGWSTNAGKVPWDILWRNNGDGTFTNVTVLAGNVKDIYPSVAAGWGDYDRDGFIDLYVANYESVAMSGYPDKLWRNNGDGTFTDVTNAANVSEAGFDAKPGRGVAWGDYNNDGWQDIYISNYRITANYLWKNRADGTFEDTAPATNSTGWYQTADRCTDYFLGGTWGKEYGHTIGSSWADYDNDGNLDVFSANLVHKYVGNTTWPTLPYDMRGYITDDSRFFKNGGAPNYNFTDVREAAGIPLKPTWTRDWGMVDSPLAPCLHTGPVAGVVGDELFSNVMWADYDLDGWQDIWLPQVYNISYANSILYHNNRDGTFYDVTTAANIRVWVDGYAGAWADYNDDGFPDLITRGIYPEYKYPYTRSLLLFENQGTSNSWLKVKLNGCTSNTAAIGARITATANGMTQMRNVEAGSGSHSQMNSLVQEFGFGAYSGTADLLIRWPNNNTQNIDSVTLRQTLRIQEPGCSVPARVPFVTADISSGAGSDVVISWERAMGDDGWLVNITGYAVYRGTAYDPSTSSYEFLGQVPPGTTSYVHGGAGIGDDTTYYYAVQTNASGGTVRSLAQAVKFGKHLAAGEQLLSIPVPISNYSIQTVLRGVIFDHLRAFDPGGSDKWLSYMPSRAINDFDTFQPNQAFWIGVIGDSHFAVAGPILPAAVISLKAGWNLVGLPSTLSRTVATAVAGLGGNFRAMEGIDPLNAPYYLRRLGMNDAVLGGEGYWIDVGSDTNWIVMFVP